MKEFVLLGTTLQYSTQRMNYFSISDLFENIAAQAEQQFQAGYKKFGNLKNVRDQFSSLLYDVLKQVDKEALAHVKRQDIYSVSRSDISVAGKDALIKIRSTYQERIMAPYEALEHKKEAEAARRELRKKIKSNDLWDSIGYTAINAVGNMGTSISAGMDASSIYHNEETMRLFLDELAEYVLAIKTVTIHLIEKNSDVGYDWPDREELKKAETLTQNILNGSVPSEKCDQLALQALQIDPHTFTLYDFLLAKHGDADHQLEEMAECFGYSDFTAHKAAMLHDKFSKPLSLTYTDEEDVLHLKKQVADYAAYLGVEPKREMAVLDKQWAAIDLRLRTANGKEYETRQQAQDVRDDIVIRDQKAASYDLRRINLLDSEQMQRFTTILTGISYKSQDIPAEIPKYVEAITRQAVDRCMAIDAAHAPNDVVEGVEKIWSLSPIYDQVAPKMKFGPSGEELVKNYSKQFSLDGDDPLCLCQDISKLLSPGKLLVLTAQKMYIVSGKETAVFPLDDILSITPQENSCVLQLKDQSPFQTPFLIKLSGSAMEQYARFLFNTVEALRLRNIPYESIYVPVEDALAAEPQPLTGLTELSADTAATPAEAPATVQINSKTSIDDKDDKRLAYAKALAACNGTPEGIQAAYNTAEKEAKAAEDAYSAELKNVPGAKTANIISVIAAFGMIFGFISIFFTSLLTGLVIAAVCIGIFSVSDRREKTLMKQAASAQSREALIQQEETKKQLEICKGYLKAKKEAEENGISAADVQDLVENLMQQS